MLAKWEGEIVNPRLVETYRRFEVRDSVLYWVEHGGLRRKYYRFWYCGNIGKHSCGWPTHFPWEATWGVIRRRLALSIGCFGRVSTSRLRPTVRIAWSAKRSVTYALPGFHL